MSSFPTDFQTSTELLSDEILTDAADLDAIQKLAERGYEVHAGVTTKFGDAIIEMALEPSIKEYCPNDSGSRFADRLAFEKWLTKGRGVFLLIKHDYTDDDLHLVGYGWTGDGTCKHIPGGETTFAIRIGEAGQGQGLATPFAQLIINASAVIYEAKDFWLETWQSNAGAVHVYHKIGFVDVDEEPGQRPSAKGQPVDDVRRYMSLSNDKLPTT